MVDCEQSLIFLCKVTARQPKHASRDKRGRKPEKEKKETADSFVLSGDNEAGKPEKLETTYK